MTDREMYLSKILSAIADELNITEEMYNKAVDSYSAVGKYLGEDLKCDVRIMPQGSMNLGTVIRPIDDSDEYDVDLVCLLEEGQHLSLDKIKNSVGDSLKKHKIYQKMLESEGKRCWTMQYDEFHMDILPCVPNGSSFNEPTFTEIKLTHKNDDGSYIPKYSNPYKYHIWFERQMRQVLKRHKQLYAEANSIKVDDVPTYKIRTPLQQAIQLLKRHRDICFQDNNENAPISIIVTTLAAKSYNGEENIYEALCNMLSSMQNYIENRDGVYWVQNPAMSAENFADKWNTCPEKREAFLDWLVRAKIELIEDPLSCMGIHRIASKYMQYLGEQPVQRALKKIGNTAKNDRDNEKLYINGLTGGLTTIPKADSIKVGGHNFFGN